MVSADYDDRHPRSAGIDSPNETHFRASEAPPDKRQKFQRLWFYNEDLKRSPKQINKNEQWRRERLYILDALSSKLGLSSYQSDRAREILDNFDMTDDPSGPFTRVEACVFAICAYVYNDENDAWNRLYLPSKANELNPQHFVELKQSIDLSDREVQQALDELESSVGDVS